MPPKTIKGALKDVLEDLSDDNFDKFRSKLLEYRKVKTRQVEGKGFIAIADLLVSVYTEAGAHSKAAEILRDIGCEGEAAELEEVIAGLSSKPGSSGAAESSAGARGDAVAEDKHFVDIHKLQIISRVSNTDPILDELLYRDVLQQGQYEDISALPTSQKKIRALYSGCLKSGTASKDVFFESLKKNEKYLIEDLKKN